MPSTNVPSFVPEQIALYQTDHLLTHTAIPAFDLDRTLAAVAACPGAIAIDLGGDKLRVATYAQTGGRLRLGDEVVHRTPGGAGYLDVLREVAAHAHNRGIPVGISAAVRLDGSVILRTTNLQAFHQDLAAGYGSDFRRLFDRSTAVVNDTAAGIAGAAVHLALRNERPLNLAFFICGSGLGASVIDEAAILHVEAAHVPLVDDLNPLHQPIHCHVEGKDFVCLERVTAMKAGIELLYEHQTGIRISAEELGLRADAGEELPESLFATSATALAHAIAGVVTRYLFDRDTAVVLHGGAFESASYRGRIARSLAGIPLAFSPRLVFARDLSANICLDGAAFLAAACNQDR
jgi:predicted NBD/HSP70 family sugar kinase